MHSNVRPRWLMLVLSALLLLGSCFADQGPVGVKPRAHGGGGGSGNGGTSTDSQGGEISLDPLGGAPSVGGEPNACPTRPVNKQAQCRTVASAEPLHLRLVSDVPQDTAVFVDDLFSQFKTNCGGCHVDANLGDKPLQVTLANFPITVTQRVVDAMHSEVEECNDATGCYNFMPPRSNSGKPWSERGEEDSIHQFATELEEWLKQGSPPDYFILPAGKGGKSPYPVDETLASSMTNLGNCIPDEGMVATEPSDACDIDARFEAMHADPAGAALGDRIGLPPTLDQTDLFTLDSAELARYGVISYAPTYPLWTDDAGKQRYIRVPRGKSVTYDREKQVFDIPKNTRFYKTFLREITTLDGSKRFRKVETRMIVSRGGAEESLFGTYEWNDEETQATLVTSPLRNGQPFTDVLKTLIIDEPKAAEAKAKKDAGEIRNYTFELDQVHAVRRYAIPGKERCIQCHMGNKDFVLGFSPLQVNQRPCDAETVQADGHCEGGILHATGESEVSQLQRLIDYGVITGFDPEKDLHLLEDPQGTEDAPRPMRTEQELVAQSYMLGNCAHCHNPIGYPTYENPELKELLNFLPSDVGGIYGFPLDRVSPRIKRGQTGDVQLPYITPSLRDIIPPDGCKPPNCEQKIVAGSRVDANGNPLSDYIDAPWRSLIYRNVDTPFTYSEDYAIYPHMPLNSPGFDCRAPRIMGSWMTSIPAKRKHPEVAEEPSPGSSTVDNDPQTYVEVKPDEPGYLNAVVAGQKRLQTYQNGSRYKTYCPDTSDIIDLDVLRGKRLTPEDGSFRVNGKIVLPDEGVPDHAHYTPTDLTESPGDWTPRRYDWQKVLTEGLGPYTGPLTDGGIAKAAWENEAKVIELLKTTAITPAMRAFAQKKLPIALWREQPECSTKLATKPTLADYAPGGPRAAERMDWMDLSLYSGKEGAHVFETVPGAAVFNMICVNCHGPNADSKGRQASTLQDMTGGTARVANFRSGLFGPPGQDGANLKRVFGSEDWAARYLPWMALGGTKIKIPTSILNLVANTEVAGERRVGFSSTGTSANMLQVGQKLCRVVALMGTSGGANKILLDGIRDRYNWGGLINKNGDAQLWEMMCAIDNPAPVRALVVQYSPGSTPYLQASFDKLYFSQDYPTSAKIGDGSGHVVNSLTQDNRFPWCVVDPIEPEAKAWLTEQEGFRKAALGSAFSAMPMCPEEFLVEANRFQKGESPDDLTDVDQWARRGAINTGHTVYLYLADLIGKDLPTPPRYNECTLLPAP